MHTGIAVNYTTGTESLGIKLFDEAKDFLVAIEPRLLSRHI